VKLPITLPRRYCLPLLLCLVGTNPAPAGLLEYVKKPEPKFAWKFNGKTESPNGTIYDLHLVSQEWHGIVWEHQLQVYQAKGTAPAATMMLWNTGGKANAGNVALGMELARKVGAPVAFLYGIPKQPLFGDKKEDGLIAETFVRCLETKDDTWPLLFPMVKSVVKAMDALEEFAKEEWKQPVKEFVISGASKRGWTSWLTGAADPRVKAIAPLVIDTLDMQKQMDYQKRSFGDYSEQIKDYTERKLVPTPKTDDAQKLWRMVDPYTYRDRLTMPKLIVCGNNDPYWTVDALNLYWDGLQGDKWITYVPNAGHNLEQKDAKGRGDRNRAVDSLAAYVKHQVTDKPLPRLKWQHDNDGGKLRLTVDAELAPKAARLWVADAGTRDFRQAPWVEQPAVLNGTKIIGTITRPEVGCRAFYADLDYEIDGLVYHLCTQIRVAGEPKSGK
jgi:PhoPQ-activated pathogenicity-related protein